MKLYKSLTNHNLEESLLGGDIGVLPTDTIYGVVASALKRKSVDRLYAVRKRPRNKPFIVLVSDIKDLKHFGVNLVPEQKAFLERNWPGEVSVILPVENDMDYLTCGRRSIAFRLPKDDKNLRRLLQHVGPLVAPSANLHGKPPAKNVNEAIQYFGENVDFYVDGGECEGISSTLVDYTGEVPEIIRQGEAVVE